MEQSINPETPMLLISDTSKVNLLIAARWAKFLSIVGFVTCVIMLIISFFMGAIFSSANPMKGFPTSGGALSPSLASGHFLSYVMTGFYIVFSILYFFPTLYLYRFATKLKLALIHVDQDNLDGSFLNISKMFRFIGICTLILLILYAVVILCSVGLVLFIAR
jgi:hypothetical protein